MIYLELLNIIEVEVVDEAQIGVLQLADTVLNEIADEVADELELTVLIVIKTEVDELYLVLDEDELDVIELVDMVEIECCL